MKYPYFRGLEADRYSFYRVPKALIKVDLFEKMSGDAKLLYAVLLDRMNLSLKNGWQDENGNAYIICTIDEIMDSIRCARQKAVKLLDELEHEYQLIERRRQGLGKPNLLYVKDLYAGLSQSNYWKYTDRKEAGSAILAACAAMKIAKTEGQIADLGGFAISSRFDAFAQTFKLTIKRQSSYTIELGSDPAGNIQRILNALASIEKTLPQVERRLETLQQQLAEAKEEVQRPFPQEAELNEKSARLAELNALLDMDEKGDDAALGMDEEVTDSELPAPKREIERSADSVKRPSILAQLHEKQAERMAEPKPQKKKSHDMEL